MRGPIHWLRPLQRVPGTVVRDSPFRPVVHRHLLAFVLPLLTFLSCASHDAAPSSMPSVRPAAGKEGQGIPITFTLETAGYVTLVIDDAVGQRVRNLMAQTWFEAGTHTVYWDGRDLGEVRNLQQKNTGSTYEVVPRTVSAGTYRVYGLVHAGVGVRYEMAVQSPGTPPWHTTDGKGAWLADHSPAVDVLFLPSGSPYGPQPQVVVCAPVAETGHGLMWLDLEGRKLYGKKIGWEGGYALARDAGPRREDRVSFYAVSIRKGRDLTLYAHQADGQHESRYAQQLQTPHEREVGVGLAAWNGTVVLSLPLEDQLLFIRDGRRIGQAPLSNPKGLWVDPAGNLYVVTQQAVQRYSVDWEAGRLGTGQVVVGSGLEDPRHLVLDERGQYYVTDLGSSHQVKVFDAGGRLVRTIGQPGGLRLGAYDAQRMHNPLGLAFDSRGRLWVAEASYLPKRLSRWNADGSFDRAWYGPPKYGGGGMIDPRDRTRFYYAAGGRGNELQGETGRGAYAFTLDWASGTATPSSLYMRVTEQGYDLLPAMGPEQAAYVGDRRFLVNTFNQAYQGMKNVVGIWRWEEDTAQARLVAVAGMHGPNANQTWQGLQAVRAHFPDPNGRFFYIWSDQNDNRRVDAAEVQYKTGVDHRGTLVSVDRDLSILTSALQTVAAPRLNERGIPVYDLSSWRSLGTPGSVDADVLRAQDGWVIHAGGPVQGFRDGRARWTYHSPWFKREDTSQPGGPGDLVETARVIGYTVTPRAGAVGELWAIASDRGGVYLLTTDGLFVQELGGDARTKPLLRTPEARRGMALDAFSFDEEAFWPSINQTEDDGSIYLVAGKEHASIFTVTGLETVRRLPPFPLTVTAADLANLPIQPAGVSSGAGAQPMAVPVSRQAPRLDGDISEWDAAAWVTLEASRNLRAALQVSGDHLYVAWQVGDPRLLANNGAEGWHYLFSTGGGLEVLLRTVPDGSSPARQTRPRDQRPTRNPDRERRPQNRNPDRAGRTPNRERPSPNQQGTPGEALAPDAAPQAGDVRLFITRVGDPVTGSVQAVLMEQFHAGGAVAPFTYESPIGRVVFDRVEEVNRSVRLAQANGVYEAAIPLALLGLDPATTVQTQGDLGVRLGNGSDTQARFYWHNKTQTTTSDLPSEARLEPGRWGLLAFRRSNDP